MPNNSVIKNGLQVPDSPAAASALAAWCCFVLETFKLYFSFPERSPNCDASAKRFGVNMLNRCIDRGPLESTIAIENTPAGVPKP